MQAACMEGLYEAWRSGTPVVSESHLLDKAGASENSRLEDLFDKRTHPAWGRLIIRGAKKGLWRLDLEI